jgi:flagellar basal-body rod modification protein FlgD
MAVDGISDFVKSNAIAATQKSEQELSMDDFFQLMVAQLQNQDMFSPMDNTQFLNQMAQFSMVNAMSDMAELSSVSYSTSLIGKIATVAFVDSSGEMRSDRGLIESVNLFNGQAEVVIGGEPYALSNVMTIDSPARENDLPLIESAHLIGKTALVMHSLDTGNVEVIQGVIESIKLVDDEAQALINGRSFPLKEITTLSETPAASAP